MNKGPFLFSATRFRIAFLSMVVLVLVFPTMLLVTPSL
jgi:hypothetical protein